ncbi:hypothetical protein Rhopal_005600-T1 [Rhodotorula paludigena]|uniref:Structure-specific endonuclease subunit SLX4 n=1 Tax=Rhodotorula paludigena TaxID=86838 RepID=A0AAV5GIV7_9BASI|nr:hypothetical protein Rhopal_005600-T1 [Rhodotorula paludigena]
MSVDVDFIISDSEPEYAVERPETSRVADRSTRRRTSDERPGLSTGEGDGREARNAEVVVLSSASEDEGADDKVISSYFAVAAAKRRRVPSPSATGDVWAGLAGLERRPSASASSAGGQSRSTSSEPHSAAFLASHDDHLRHFRSPSAPALDEVSIQPEAAASDAQLSIQPSFVSARDLLRDASTSTSEEDLPALSSLINSRVRGHDKSRRKKASERPPPTVKKATAVPHADAKGRARTHKARRRTSAPSVDADEPEDAVSDAPSASASSTSSLPRPTDWGKLFSHGAASAQPRAPVSSSSSQDLSAASRAKPWEKLEAQPVKATIRKAPGRSRRKKTATSVEVETLEIDELSSDNDNVAVASNVAKVKTETTGSRRVSAKKSTASLAFLPTPLALPADERIRPLTSCPLCQAKWPDSKALASKQTHLRSCAGKRFHSAEEVAFLVGSQVLHLAEAADAERRAKEESKTLFDIAIGRGQGASAKSDVQAVGVEGTDDPTTFYRATSELQLEMEGLRKKDEKPKEAKLGRIAKEIRRERAALPPDQRWDKAPQDTPSSDHETLPPATGRLRPESSTARKAVAERADALLGGVGVDTVPLGSDDDDVLLGDRADFAFTSSPPRPTQVFEPSDLVDRFDPDTSIEIIARPAGAAGASASTSGAAARRSRSPFRQLSLQDPCSDSESDEGPPDHPATGGRHVVRSGSSSLWSIAAGRDDAAIAKVVVRCDRSLPSAVVQPTDTPDAEAPPAGAPDYAGMTVAALQREVAKYGFRASREKSVLVRQLHDVWRAMHPDGAAAAGDADVSPPKKRGRRKKKDAAAAAASADEGAQVEEEKETVGEKLRRLIVADEALYIRILRYEPIHFDEFVRLAASNGVKVSKPLLMRCLDEQLSRDTQSITFYSQDPTGGTRRRYR